MVLASSPDKHEDKGREPWHPIAYADKDLDASEPQNDWPEGSPKRIYRYSPRLLVRGLFSEVQMQHRA
jgi:hypothetical protein